jgi:biopolymer transport protein TolQ
MDKTESFQSSPIAMVFRSGVRELRKLSSDELSGAGIEKVENIQRALIRASNTEITHLEKNVGWLATTASAAPFVGLFGTVWGIMNAFQNIGATGAANLAVVAPGISEALITTAFGIGAAIPAVVAYNHFSGLIRRVSVDMESFSQDFMNIIQRSVLAGSGVRSKE